MKKGFYACILIGFFAVAIIFYSGCAHTERKKESIYPEGKLFHQPYDKVWDAVYSLIFTDLGCVDKKVNKKKGYIETEWATKLSAEGTSRWRIKAQVKQKNDGTLVLFDRDIEERDVVDKNDMRSREKSKDQNPNAGWRHNNEDAGAADNLYQQLDSKLK
jgi:hypothetical protein